MFADESSEIHRFASREEMWCCELKPTIGAMLDDDVRARESRVSGNAQSA